MNTISVKNFSVEYEGVPVLQDLSLEIGKGEFVAIVGKSGSGKSTLLHALAGLIPSKGAIYIPKKKDVVFQNYAVFPWLTVYENISYGSIGLSKEEQKEKVNEYLNIVGLTNKANMYPAQLSGGQIQRIALARSLVYNPDILLMDEPYGALDAHTRDEMQKLLIHICVKFRKTVIFVTHSIEEAIFLADRVFILKSGKFEKEFVVPFEKQRGDELKFSEEFNKLRKEIYKLI